jgi:hypothetical protein
MRVGGKTHEPVGLLPGKYGPRGQSKRVGKMSLPRGSNPESSNP